MQIGVQAGAQDRILFSTVLVISYAVCWDVPALACLAPYPILQYTRLTDSAAISALLAYKLRSISQSRLGQRCASR